jgi:hypothetical protein
MDHTLLFRRYYFEVLFREYYLRRYCGVGWSNYGPQWRTWNNMPGDAKTWRGAPVQSQQREKKNIDTKLPQIASAGV